MNSSRTFEIVVVTDALRSPFDEATRVFCRDLVQHLARAKNVTLTIVSESKARSGIMCRLRLLYGFLSVPKGRSTSVLYIPLASMTFWSFVHAALIRLLAGRHAKVFCFALQKRTLSKSQMFLVRYLFRPHVVFSRANSVVQWYTDSKINSIVLDVALDLEKFHPVSDTVRRSLRDKYRIPHGNRVVLHVGHPNSSRNLDLLAEVASMADWIVLFVSSSRPADSGIISKLEASGVRVFRGYYEDIQTFYQLADLYLFPVSSELGAVDLPLSILEALACNLPVVSTPYHGIRDVFRENDAITYFTNGDDVINLMRNLSSSDACSTRQSPRRLVEFKTYENLVHALLEYIRESSKRSDCTDLAVRSNAGKHK